MKKRILLSLALTGGLALTGVAAVPALAAGKSSGSEHASSRHHDHGFRAGGTVSAVDGTALTITLTGKNSTTTTYAVSSTAKITVDRTVTALGDLKAGLRVQVRGTTADDTKTVTRIEAWTTVPTASPSSSSSGDKGRGRDGRKGAPSTAPTDDSTTEPTTDPSA